MRLFKRILRAFGFLSLLLVIYIVATVFTYGFDSTIKMFTSHVYWVLTYVSLSFLIGYIAQRYL